MPLPNMHPYADADIKTLMTLLGDSDLETLQRQAMPAQRRDPGKPDDEILKYAAALYRQEFGRRLFNVLFERSLHVRAAPSYPTFEASALAASKVDALVGFGEFLLAMIAEGERLLTQPKDAKDENAS